MKKTLIFFVEIFFEIGFTKFFFIGNKKKICAPFPYILLMFFKAAPKISTYLDEKIGTDDDLERVIKDEKGIDVIGFSVFHEVRPPNFDNVDV